MKKGFSDSDVLEYVKRFMVENGYTPTVRDICKGMGLSSASSVQSHFIRLQRSGDIIRIGDRYKVKGMRYVSDE